MTWTGRRIIEELLPLADDIERRLVAASLPELDDGFLKATIPTSHAFGAKRSHKNMTTSQVAIGGTSEFPRI
jgi:hypothetical protein